MSGYSSEGPGKMILGKEEITVQLIYRYLNEISSQKQRAATVFRLTSMQGWSIKEVAVFLAVSESQVGRMLAVGRQYIVRRLREDGYRL